MTSLPLVGLWLQMLLLVVLNTPLVKKNNTVRSMRNDLRTKLYLNGGRVLTYFIARCVDDFGLLRRLLFEFLKIFVSQVLEN